MDTPKPVVPVNNFAPQSLGLKGLLDAQATFAGSGTIPVANNTLPTSTATLEPGGPDAYFNHITTDKRVNTTGLRSPLESARRYDDPSLGFDVNRESNEDLYAQTQ